MSTIAIYDYDFFTYKQVIPNLECAKLVTYYRNHNEISLLSPTLNPAPYTKFILRKEYEDGIYPPLMFAENCEYGGRAFNPNYLPFDKAIEHTIPDMHLYDKYATQFGDTKIKWAQFRRVLNCAHIRLSLDGQIPDNEKFLFKNLEGVSGIILHDYNLSQVDGALDLLKKLSNSRTYVDSDKIRPLPIGNKYPIIIHNSKELLDWSTLPTIPGAFFLEYSGLIENEDLVTLVEDAEKFSKQIYYDVTGSCKDEEDFLKRIVPVLFKQVLFLKRKGVKILLKYGDNFFKTKPLQDFVELMNCYLSVKWQENFMPYTQTLYRFCSSRVLWSYENFYHKIFTLKKEEIREVFQYIMDHDYETFQKFYNWDAVTYKDGNFINDWTGNS